MNYWLVFAVSLLLLTGCGKKGNLSPPPADIKQPLTPDSPTQK